MVQTGVNNSGDPNYTPWAFNEISSGADELGAANGTGISIASAGSYVKPTNLHIQADMLVNADGTAMQYARGVALGFYDSTHNFSKTLLPMQGFIGLVLANDGGLYVYNGESYNANNYGTYSSKVAFGGTFNASAYAHPVV